jgi:AraC-like DNA-binding protein
VVIARDEALMDPLSEVLSLLKPRSTLSAGFDAGGQWSIRFPDQHKCIKCYAVVSGACWLGVDGVPDPVRLKAGDCFVLPSGRPFRLASDMSLEPVAASTIFPPERPGGVATLNGGGDFFCVGSRFAVSGSHANILMGMLPPIVHIRNESDQAALRWAVEHMRHELREQQPGSILIAQHLAHMMLIQALRMHLAEMPNGSGTGWLAALSDRHLGLSINAMHSEPARRWTLQELADRACMSRSAFAQKFKDAVGLAPMEYLVRWRMLLAADRLERSSEPVSSIALSLGYESESAFSTAFKREMGDSPRRYGRERRHASIPNGEAVQPGGRAARSPFRTAG